MRRLTQHDGGDDSSSPFSMLDSKYLHRPVVLVAVLFSVQVGCAPARPAAVAVEPVSHRAPLVEELLPPISTLEHCYNAWDDNENGLIDEGCSTPQAPIQVLVAWAENQSDLDLLVHDPNGELATVQAPTAAGMSLLRDCPGAEGCQDQPIEIVSSGEEEWTPGQYRVMVLVRRLEDDRHPLVARLGIRTPGGTQAYRLEFYEQAQSVTLDFSVAGVPQKE